MRTPISVVPPCDLLDQIDDATPELGLLDLHEGLGEGKPVRGGEEVRYVARGGSLGHAVGLRMEGRRALEEECHRDLQNMGNLLQPAGPYSVRSLLVFLHLLEGETQCATELFLAHRQHHAAHAHATADVLVDGIRGLLSHNTLLWDLDRA